MAFGSMILAPGTVLKPGAGPVGTAWFSGRSDRASAGLPTHASCFWRKSSGAAPAATAMTTAYPSAVLFETKCATGQR